MKLRFSIGLTLLIFLFQRGIAQEYYEKLFTVKDGLPSNRVKTVFQDHSGFIWISTDNGLARFDGYTFKVFHHNVNDSNSLSDNRITVINEDRQNRIWIGTYGGLNIFDPVQQKFTRYAIPVSEINNISNQQVTQILIDVSGRIWIGTYNGLFYFDPSKKMLKEFVFDSLITVKNYYNWILHLYADRHFIYAVTNHGDATIDLHSLQPYYANKDSKETIPHNEKILIQADTNQIFSFIKNQLTKKWGLWSFRSNPKDSILLVKNADSLVNLGYGLLRFDERHFLFYSLASSFLVLNDSTGQLQKFQFNHLKSAENVVLTRNKSGNENFWCATLQGLYLFSRKSNPFRLINLSTIEKPFHPLTSIQTLFCSRSKELWMASSDGTMLTDSAIHILRFFPPKYRNTSHDYNAVWNIYADKAEKIWIGRQCGYSMYDPLKKTMKDFFIERNDNTTNNYYVGTSFLQTDDSTIWIGSNKGLAEADVRNGKVRGWFTYNPANPKKFPLHRVLKIATDSMNHYWLVSDEGLFSFNPETKTFKTFQETFSTSVHLNGDIVDVKQMRNFLLIATARGLNLFNTQNRQLRVFTYNDGLPNEEIRDIICENDHICWLTTASGLSRFDLDHSTFSNFNYKDGLPSFEIDFSDMVRLSSAKFLFAADSDIILFDPAEIGNSFEHPSVSITDFFADKQSYFIQEDSTHKIHLDWNNRVINIHFSTLNYSDADFAQFQYQLVNTDRSWNNAFTKNEVNYSDLPPGSYRFEVRASYGNGSWGEPAALYFQIAAPFWRTNWFYILAGIVILSIPALILWNIISRQRAKILQQEQLNRERRRISAELHDDVGSVLTKIAMLGKAIEMNPAQNKKLISRITTSAEAMVDHMNEIIWALNTRNDTLQNLLSYIRRNAGELLGEKFILEFNDPVFVPEIAVSGEVRRNVFLVVKEALHNIVKHSNAQHVEITFAINHELIITILDDGLGITEEKKNNFGNGLLNMQQRMEEIRGNFQIQSSSNGTHGTKIRLIVPLK